jgi:hypothetical protein
MTLNDTLIHFVTLVRKKLGDVKEKEEKKWHKGQEKLWGEYSIFIERMERASGYKKIDDGGAINHQKEDIQNQTGIRIVFIVQIRNKGNGSDGTEKAPKQNQWDNAEVGDEKFRRRKILFHCQDKASGDCRRNKRK